MNWLLETRIHASSSEAPPFFRWHPAGEASM
jgi:hypothetical protein